jgi:hypothetical protein
MSKNVTVPVDLRPLANGKLPVDHILDVYSVSAIAAAMNLTERTVQRWATTGVNGWTADKLAVEALGANPYNVWGRAFDEVFDEALV